nr:MAG TPA: hypothetical protein [Caudoviricetes sp.]
MPVSKKPRKKGKRGAIIAASRRFARNKFSSVEQANRDYRLLKKDAQRCAMANEPLKWMIALTEFDNVQKGFLRSLAALDRWPTSTDPDDFNMVISSLMIGILIFRNAKIAERDVLRDMQSAAFMCVQSVRLRNYGKQIPDANVDAVRNGLVVAQSVMGVAYEEDRQAFIDALVENSKEYIAEHPGIADEHYRLALGSNYQRVCEWEKEDAFRLKGEKNVIHQI